MPLQLQLFGNMPLQLAKPARCHRNFFQIGTMPLCTSESPSMPFVLVSISVWTLVPLAKTIQASHPGPAQPSLFPIPHSSLSANPSSPTAIGAAPATTTGTRDTAPATTTRARDTVAAVPITSPGVDGSTRQRGWRRRWRWAIPVAVVAVQFREGAESHRWLLQSQSWNVLVGMLLRCRHRTHQGIQGGGGYSVLGRWESSPTCAYLCVIFFLNLIWFHSCRIVDVPCGFGKISSTNTLRRWSLTIMPASTTILERYATVWKQRTSTENLHVNTLKYPMHFYFSYPRSIFEFKLLTVSTK